MRTRARQRVDDVPLETPVEVPLVEGEVVVVELLLVVEVVGGVAVTPLPLVPFNPAPGPELLNADPLLPRLLLGERDDPGLAAPLLVPVVVPALPVLPVPGEPTPEPLGALVLEPLVLGSWVVPVVFPMSITPGAVGLVPVVPDGVVVPNGFTLEPLPVAVAPDPTPEPAAELPLFPTPDPELVAPELPDPAPA